VPLCGFILASISHMSRAESKDDLWTSQGTCQSLHVATNPQGPPNSLHEPLQSRVRPMAVSVGSQVV